MMIVAIMHSISKDGLHTKEYKTYLFFGRLSTDILNRIPFVNLPEVTFYLDISYFESFLKDNHSLIPAINRDRHPLSTSIYTC